MTLADGWVPVQRLRTHEQVMSQIEERILSGQLKPGDRLPSERDLSSILGVSRPSLRESLRVLESLGILEIHRGGGTDGGAVLVGEPGAGLVNLLKLQLALGHFSQTDVLETRIVLECWSLAEAAVRATDADHRELEEILDRMDSPDIETPEFNSLDTAFHVKIAESTGNALTAHLMGSLRVAINRQMIDAYASLENWRENAKAVRAQHREMLEALRARQAERAVQLVRDHIKEFYNLGKVNQVRLE
jgi:GntR family transcriptional repressor for pyruvate dehydrogenase complex